MVESLAGMLCLGVAAAMVAGLLYVTIIRRGSGTIPRRRGAWASPC